MFFKLQDFIKETEFSDYKVVRNGGYDFTTGENSKYEFIASMFIYKKDLKIVIANETSGLYESSQLNGKCLKKYNLKNGDVLEVEGLSYRITQVFPRLHADFVEFVMELIRND